MCADLTQGRPTIFVNHCYENGGTLSTWDPERGFVGYTTDSVYSFVLLKRWIDAVRVRFGTLRLNAGRRSPWTDHVVGMIQDAVLTLSDKELELAIDRMILAYRQAQSELADAARQRDEDAALLAEARASGERISK